MTNQCAKFKDLLLEAALSGTTPDALAQHVQLCTACGQELAALRERRHRMDALLPQLSRGAEPSPAFRARVLAATAQFEPAPFRWPGVWALAGAAAALAVLVTGFALHRSPVGTAPEAELAAAQKLAQWRAPSDVLLQTPGQEMLRLTPVLGDSYLKISPRKGKVDHENENRNGVGDEVDNAVHKNDDREN